MPHITTEMLSTQIMDLFEDYGESMGDFFDIVRSSLETNFEKSLADNDEDDGKYAALCREYFAKIEEITTKMQSDGV